MNQGKFPLDDESLDRILRDLAPVTSPGKTPAETMAFMSNVAAGAGLAAHATAGTVWAWWKIAAVLVAGISLGVFGDRFYQQAMAQNLGEEGIAASYETIEKICPQAQAEESQLAAAEPEIEPPAPVTIAVAPSTCAEVPKPRTGVTDVAAQAAPSPASTRFDDAQALEDDGDWFEDVDRGTLEPPAWDHDEERETANTDPGPPDTVVPVAQQDIQTRTHRPILPGDTQLQLGGGALTTPGIFVPRIQASIAYHGPSKKLSRPMLTAGVDLGLMSTIEDTTWRFMGGIDVGAGIVLGGSRLRFDFAWTIGANMVPGAAMAESMSPLQPRWLEMMTGPELALIIYMPKGPGLRLGTDIKASFRPVDGMSNPFVQPWFGLTVGVDLPLKRPVS